MSREATHLVIGRGEVFFEAFLPGTRQGRGERYIGNTTSFQVSRTVERLERATSHGGQKVTREAAVLRDSHTVQFVTDNIDMENVALWFGGEADSRKLDAQGIITETLRVRLGNYIQLGKTYSPNGVRNIENVVVRAGATVVPAGGNYEIDVSAGRIRILPDAFNIADGALIDVEFEWRTTYLNLATSMAKEVFGALRFMAENVAGESKRYYFPMVRLSARGSVDLKGDQWQQIPFEAEAMKINHRSEQVYVETIAFTLFLEDEQAILDEGLTLDEFPIWDDELHQFINVQIPSHNY